MVYVQMHLIYEWAVSVRIMWQEVKAGRKLAMIMLNVCDEGILLLTISIFCKVFFLDTIICDWVLLLSRYTLKRMVVVVMSGSVACLLILFSDCWFSGEFM